MADRNSYSSFKEYPGPIKRQGPFNLDLTGSYTSRQAALEYAQTDPSAYDGQILTVTETNSDGSTALYYFGIKNNENGESTLMQIMTLTDAENLIKKVGAVKYKGTLSLVQDPSDKELDYIHTTFEAIEAGYALTPQIGDMYNVWLSNSTLAQRIHAVNALEILPPTGSFNTASEDLYIFSATEGEDGSYAIEILIGSYANGSLPPLVKNCLNLFEVRITGEETVTQCCYYDTWAYGYKNAGSVYIPTLTIHLKAYPEAELDPWAKGRCSMIPGTTSAVLLTPAQMYSKVSSAIATDSATPLLSGRLAFTVEINNGDNIVYNGHFWDVLSGTVDISNLASKEELSQAVSNSVAIYRQE